MINSTPTSPKIYRIAELTWLNYVDPFPRAQLWDGPALDYFARPKAGIYRAQTAFTSFVKTQRIAALRHARWVVDWGAGQGADLGRYLAAEVGNLVGVDRDRAALAELVRRKYSHARRGRAGDLHLGRPDPRSGRGSRRAAAGDTASGRLGVDAHPRRLARRADAALPLAGRLAVLFGERGGGLGHGKAPSARRPRRFPAPGWGRNGTPRAPARGGCGAPGARGDRGNFGQV